MGSTSRAVVFAGNGTWELRDFPIPAVPDGGAVLRVEAVGMCHSDVDQFHGLMHTPAGGVYPSVPGHEIVGRIDRMSPATSASWGVSEGDRVAVNQVLMGPEGLLVYGHDFSADEPPGLFGGFADYMVLLPGTQVHRLPDDIPAEELTIFEPLSNAVTWVRPVTEGDTVIVEGPGHLGMATVIAAKAAGAASVIVTGTAADASRLDTALRVGADHTVDVESEDVAERVREITAGRMADVVVDAASGSPQTVTIALDLVRVGGHVVIAGLKNRKPVEGFVSDWIPLRQITIHPGAGMDVEKAVALIATGQVPTRELVGETFPLEQFEDAFALMSRTIPGRDAVRTGLLIS